MVEMVVVLMQVVPPVVLVLGLQAVAAKAVLMDRASAHAHVSVVVVVVVIAFAADVADVAAVVASVVAVAVVSDALAISAAAAAAAATAEIAPAVSSTQQVLGFAIEPVLVLVLVLVLGLALWHALQLSHVLAEHAAD